MTKFKIETIEDPCRRMKDFFYLSPFEPDSLKWLSENISFADDVSSEQPRLNFDLYPYQKEPIQYSCSLVGRKECTCVWCEQTGKTNAMLMAMLYRWVFAPGQFLVVYPGGELAIATNETKLKPLISHIPALAPELDRPRSCRSDRFKFSNSVMWFQGAGQQIVSKSCQSVFLDEVDAWPVEYPNNPRDARKRTRSFTNSLVFDVCSPIQQNGHIWQSFLKSSQGYYTLRCQKCGKLTMRSCDIHNLEFESTFHEELRQFVVKKGSERLICPECGFEHTEDMKHDMIVNGEYVHKIPELKEEHSGFQVGALASQLPALSWSNIANAQLEAGKTSDLPTQMNFDRSWRGLPYMPRKVTKDEIQRLKDYHKEDKILRKEDIEMIIVGADTMDQYLRYVVAAWDIHDNIHLLEAGEAETFDLLPEKRAELNKMRREKNEKDIITLGDILKRKWHDLSPSMCLIDAGGHRQSEVTQFCKDYSIAFMQKGTSMVAKQWYRSDKMPKMFILNTKTYQAMTLYQMYLQKNRDENFLFISDDIEDIYLEELKDIKPDDGSKWGTELQNWKPKTGNDHTFDALKYVYAAREICLALLHRDKFLQCKSPSLLKRFKTRTETEHNEQEQKQSEYWKV